MSYDWRSLPASSPQRADAPPVVFLNGLSQTTVAWGLQAQRLRGRRSVLLVDGAGQGRSTPAAEGHRPEGHRPAGHARDLVHLLDALGIGAVDAVGFSFGSRIALRLALQAPARVRRLVLVGCAHRDTTLRRWIVASWLEALERGGREHAFRVVTPLVMGEAWLARNEAGAPEMLRAFLRRNTEDGMRRLLLDSLLPGGDLGEELRSVRAPALVVRGEEDLLVSRALSRELVALLPDARLEERPGAGHTVAIEEPEWFAERVAGFLGTG